MKKIFVLLFFLLCGKLWATHIVGGELIYDHLGNNKYRIVLKVYRDCLSGVANFDGLVTSTPTGTSLVNAVLTVMETLNASTAYTLDLGAPVVTKIPPTINNPCIKTPNTVCVQEGIYTMTVTLPPVAGGDIIVYQRCCRNSTVLNLLNSGNQGSSYYAKIPGPEQFAQNSSPRFRNFPPIFLCNNLNYSFDHSAVDPDGDQLVYSLCAPYQGLDACCANMGGNPSFPTSGCPNPPAECPPVASAPPYPQVLFISPYDGSYPISSNPAITINPVTGQLSGQPDLIGQFVVGVCVQEFRNGELIDTHYRDFQFNIVGCVVNLVSAVADQESRCAGFNITFTNQSTSNVGQAYYHWDFGVPGIMSDTSNLVNASYTYQDTGVYILTLVSGVSGVCKDTLKKEVYVYPPLDIRFTRPPAQCLLNNSFGLKVEGAFNQQATFVWDFGAAGTPTGSTQRDPPAVSFNRSGYLPIWLKARQYSCRDSFIDSIRIYNRPKAVIGGFPGALCTPATLHFRNLSYSDLPFNSFWQFSDGGNSTDFEPRLIFQQPGSFDAVLVIKTTSVCVDTSSALKAGIMINPSPNADFSCFPEVTSIFEPQIIFTDQSSPDVFNWRYAFGDGDSSRLGSPVHTYREFGNFTVTQLVVNRYGCKDTVSRLVIVEPEFRLWVPNAFTPDNNGVNEVFRPSVYGVEDYSFQIYDEWGQVLFETADPTVGWDGTKKQSACPQDVYIWRLVFKNQVSKKQEERCGHILLLRNP